MTLHENINVVYDPLYSASAPIKHLGCDVMWYKCILFRHPDTSSRPSFTEVLEALSEPETDLLRWSAEDTAVHPQAAVLGAPLEAGVDLYPELQETYSQ